MNRNAEKKILIARAKQGLSKVENSLLSNLFDTKESDNILEQLIREELYEFVKKAMILMNKEDKRRKKLLKYAVAIDATLTN